jgi:hypothetical protein
VRCALQMHADVEGLSEGPDLGDDWVAKCQAAVAGLLQDDAYAARCVAARLVPRLFPLSRTSRRAPLRSSRGPPCLWVENGLHPYCMVGPNHIRTVPLSAQNACREHCLGLLSFAHAQQPEERKRIMQPDVRLCMTHHSPGRYRHVRRLCLAKQRRQPDTGCMGRCRQAAFSKPGGLQARLCIESLPACAPRGQSRPPATWRPHGDLGGDAGCARPVRPGQDGPAPEGVPPCGREHTLHCMYTGAWGVLSSRVSVQHKGAGARK